MANTSAGPRHVRIACGNATTAQVIDYCVQYIYV